MISNYLIDEICRQGEVDQKRVTEIRITPRHVYFTLIHEMTDSIKFSVPVCECKREENDGRKND
jgi:hypothetical protein